MARKKILFVFTFILIFKLLKLRIINYIIWIDVFKV
jgi:hypothetical protein